jgi:DNA-binding response OmpR family regulator
MKHLLLVDDDSITRTITENHLIKVGFDVKTAVNLEMATATFRKQHFDLILLDLTLPDGNGLDWAKEVKRQIKCPPIIFLTSHTDITDIRMGFEMGGADYVKKPFEMEELILRIKHVLNDFNTGSGQERHIGEYVYNPTSHLLKHNGQKHILGRLQGGILDELSIKPGAIVSKEKLLQKYWGDANYFTSCNLDSVIVKLRKHFKEDPSVYFLALKKEGYRLVIYKD